MILTSPNMSSTASPNKSATGGEMCQGTDTVPQIAMDREDKEVSRYNVFETCNLHFASLFTC